MNRILISDPPSSYNKVCDRNQKKKRKQRAFVFNKAQEKRKEKKRKSVLKEKEPKRKGKELKKMKNSQKKKSFTLLDLHGFFFKRLQTLSKVKLTERMNAVIAQSKGIKD